MSDIQRAQRPVLVCPECSRIYGGTARIGNRKSTCKLCNRFSQAVKRAVAAYLNDAHPDEAATVRAIAETKVHEQMFPSTEALR